MADTNENMANAIREFLMILAAFLVAVFRGMWRAVGWVPQKSIMGEIVVITGAGSGIGRLVALELSQRGAVIVGWDVNTSGNEETVRLIKSKGARAHAYTVDVSSKESVYKAAEKVKTEVGTVGILINNAGIVVGKKVLDIPDEMVIKTFDVNVISHFWTTRSFLPEMLKNNHGHIVNIASVAGVVGCNRLSDYCASKFADVGFTETLDMEIVGSGSTGVHTTLVCPYFIGTGMFAGCQTRFPWLLPVLEPDWVAKRIVKAMLTNQKQLFLPKIMYVLNIIKSIFPVDAVLILHKYMGATNFMDTFIGRQQKQK